MSVIVVYITCKNIPEAKKIGFALVKKRLAACSVVIPGATSFYWWPPRAGKIAQRREAILLVKTIRKNLTRIEHEMKKLHSYTVPCILAITTAKAQRPYLKWLKGKLKAAQARGQLHNG